MIKMDTSSSGGSLYDIEWSWNSLKAAVHQGKMKVELGRLKRVSRHVYNDRRSRCY